VINPAEFGFWVATLTIIYVYVLYPALLAFIALFYRRPRPELGHAPFLSILIAASNEEQSIEKKLRDTLLLDYPPDRLEVLVISDGSMDRTDEIVRGFPDSRVRLIRVPVRMGKTHAQNVAVDEARGEILVFSDATTLYHAQSLRYLAANYQDPRVGAVSGRYQYFDSEHTSPTGLGTIAFWNYENRIKIGQSRIRTLTGCCGCIYSVRKSAYTKLPKDIISDLVQPLCVIGKGYRVSFEERALAFEKTTDSSREEMSMRVRVITRGMRGLLSVPDLLKPWKYPWVAFQLFSHKILRWLVPVFLVALLGFNFVLLQHAFFRAALLLQLSFYLLAAFQTVIPMHRSWRPLGVPLYFCVLNTAAALALFELLRGKRYVVWQPVRSRG
jgi:cellulose synthase/poly-beta-1,6-N-acetylglucosamine synthase-like glycosyltransferase